MVVTHWEPTKNRYPIHGDLEDQAFVLGDLDDLQMYEEKDRNQGLLLFDASTSVTGSQMN